MEKGDVVRIDNNRLAPSDRMMRAVLAKAIDEAIADEAATPDAGFSVALPAREAQVWSPPSSR